MLKSILNNPRLLKVLNGQLRHAGTFAGGVLVTYGVIEATDVSTFAGIVATVGGMVFSAMAKKV